ncbi:Hint domain-containing protein [Teichococcus vastitatis]|uniref:Hint domain-containing protein n=1 Tax=Teichococcus vastitatis TaxID=2307076 RepID=A0ABS9W8D6_9PROT|nr:Hint domain-containing protein [Pseudoroseomonas vastitatis]MCI0755554.1 Hint domain-containing protein [Pseudoroseomonas vastitatis]
MTTYNGTSGADTYTAPLNELNTISGSTGDDFLVGGDLSDIINGEDGNDTLIGRAGADNINGGTGRDQIFGNGGRDTLNGGAGNDVIDGGRSADIINGGAGNDILTGGPGDDQIDGGNGTDIVTYNDNFEDYVIARAEDGSITVEGSDGTDAVTNAETFQFNDVSYAADDIPCFLRGTRILTTRGEVAVEDLREGDLIVTLHDYGRSTAPVVWIGQRSIRATSHPDPLLVMPIRVAAGALAEGVPQRDLLVSRHHCLVFDGMLVEAHWLVNGATITREMRQTVDYFHVELDQHGVLLAEGAAAESYLDTGNRGMFANASTPALHAAEATAEQRLAMPGACAPILTDSAALAALQTRLTARAEILGWRRAGQAEAWLEVDGTRLPANREGEVLRWQLPAGATTVRLCSESAVPFLVEGSSTDRRRLGLAVRRLRLVAPGAELLLLPTCPLLTEGFAQAEHSEHGELRWTNGDADLTSALRPLLTLGGELRVAVMASVRPWHAPLNSKGASAA